jgi:formylglycine-generating enzyme required for sulfatase activity
MVNKVAFLFLFLLFLASCRKDDSEKKDSLEISVESVSFNAQKDESMIVVRTDENWTAQSDAEWITFSTYEGEGSTGFIVGASANPGFKRETKVSVVAGKLTKDIKVVQLGVTKIEFEINGVKFKFLPVNADTSFYLDGSTYLATRRVYLDSYFISETEITNAQWKAVAGSLPYNTENNLLYHPVVVNWKQINELFIPKISLVADYQFRLPTENEWEVAARGGLLSGNTKYAGSINIDQVAWHWKNSEGKKHKVALKKANELGLYDMSGNVSEWCNDWYAEWTDANRPSGELVNPKGPASGTLKVIRGGDFRADRFEYDRNSCSITTRSYLPPDISTEGFLYDGYNHYTGFRLVIASK